MYKQQIIVPQQLNTKFTKAWKHSRVLLFSAFCGFGKTAVALKLLEKYRVTTRQIVKGEALDLNGTKRDEVMFIEDIHLLKDPVEIEKLTEFMRQEQGLKFVLTTRGTMPGWLVPFQLDGLLQQFKEQDLRFGKVELNKVAECFQIQLKKAEQNGIIEQSKGYPTSILIYLHTLSEGVSNDEPTKARVAREIFSYIEKYLFDNLEVEEQEFLIKLAPFHEFTIDLAQYINNKNNTRNIIESLLLDTTMLIQTGEDSYAFNYVAKSFVLWQFHKQCYEEEKLKTYMMGGQYYEKNRNIVKALECYTHARNYERITYLLKENAEQNPGVGHFLEMEKYYLAVPRENVMQSATLMSGMSMLMSMRAYYEKSELWYAELVAYIKTLDKSSEVYKRAVEKRMYLDIALPQKSNDSLMETITKMSHYVGNSQLKRPSFSITSRLPSVLNGGKDFSDWAKKDDILYKTVKKPLEKMLHNEGIGVIDCGMCESKFEKGKDYAPYLVRMMSELPEVQQHGTADVEFAIIGTIARIHIGQGKVDAAKQSLMMLREKFMESGETRFLTNIDAMIAHMSLLQGDVETAIAWKEASAPKRNDSIWTMWRYQYFIKIEVMIQESEYMEALLLLTQLLVYTQKCGRKIDEIQVHALMAICYFRMDSIEWKESLQKALSLSEEYQFVNTIAQFGMGVLPLLTNQKWKGDKEFQAKVLRAARIHATFYQQYLKQTIELTEKLSTMELAVLRLICQNKSNQEICDILGIKLPTVKTHASNIYRKLDVNRRAEAKAEAIRRNLVEEYI